jgi:hypothetical protein
MGHAFLWIYTLALALGSAVLIRGALIRTRGYIHLATGAGILLAILLLSFIDPDVLNLPASLLASSAIAFSWVHTYARRKAVLTPLQSERTTNLIVPVQDKPPQLRERVLRLACGLGALILTIQACWILVPEAFAARGSSTAISAGDRNDLDRGASLAVVRGDLWAQSGLAHVGISERKGWPDGSPRQARASLVNALRFSPYQARVWLILARLSNQFGWAGYDPAALLKMSYYTAATDARLLPATLKLALHLRATETDVELQDLVRRDTELVLRRFPVLRPALAEAVEGARPGVKALAEHIIGQLDPDFLRTVQPK